MTISGDLKVVREIWDDGLEIVIREAEVPAQMGDQFYRETFIRSEH